MQIKIMRVYLMLSIVLNGSTALATTFINDTVKRMPLITSPSQQPNDAMQTSNLQAFDVLTKKLEADRIQWEKARIAKEKEKESNRRQIRQIEEQTKKEYREGKRRPTCYGKGNCVVYDPRVHEGLRISQDF